MRKLTGMMMAASLAVAMTPAMAMAQESGAKPAESKSLGDNNGAVSTLQSQAADNHDKMLEKAAKERRELNRKELDKRRKAWGKEVGETYKDWLEKDVPYIITDEERSAFMMLSNDDERDKFIEAFWAVRDPTPDTEENEYKEEHYRRIAYANDHFASGVQGWRTDRGRMYIMWGPADEVESHPSGGSYNRSMEEGGGTTSTFPFERWRYRHIDGIGEQVIIEFVDTCQCNEYHMSIDPDEKDALLKVPGAGNTLTEEMGTNTRSNRVLGMGDLNNPFDPNNPSKKFDRLTQQHLLYTPPPIKFKDLDEMVTHKIMANFFKFDVHWDTIRVTSDTILVPVTVQMRNKEITFINKEGLQTGTVNIYGRVSTMTGKIVQVFEDTVSQQVPEDLLQAKLEQPSVYWKALPLHPGRYKLDVVLKDVNGDKKGFYEKALLVPSYPDEKLATSTLILADIMEKVPRVTIGAGSFVVSDMKIRPKVEASENNTAAFKKAQNLNLWMQVYNLQMDEKAKQVSGTLTCEIINAASNKSVYSVTETTESLSVKGNQMTFMKTLPLKDYEPGVYRVTLTVTDNVSGQKVSTPGRFMVE